MRFERHRVETQVKLMVERLVNGNHIEVHMQKRPALCAHIERIIERYIERFDEIQDKVQKFIVDHGLNEDEYARRIRRNLAEEEELPIYADAYDYLNEQIEAYLWDADEVEELFADKRELVALITPFLKAMATKA